MSRPLRLNIPHACYLVSFEGVEGLGLFVEEEDARHFEELLSLSRMKQRVMLHAYALGANAAELVVETPEANLGRFMQGVLTAFARHIRHYYVHSGPIVQGRYRAKVLEKSEGLSKACAWVHTLPLREAGEPAPSRWNLRTVKRFSSHSSLLPLLDADVESIASPDAFLRLYGSPKQTRLARHFAQCERILAREDVTWEAWMQRSSLALGSEAFVSEMHRLQSQLQQGKRVTGVQVYGRRPKGLSRTVILEVVAETFDRPTSDFFHQKHSSPLRPTLAYLLYRFGAMTQQEIADTIGVKSSAAVSLQIKRLLAARKTAKDLDETLTDLENRLAHL